MGWTFILAGQTPFFVQWQPYLLSVPSVHQLVVPSSFLRMGLCYPERDWVRSALSVTGVNTAHYSGHSFWVEAATIAARAGLSETTNKEARSLGISRLRTLCLHAKGDPGCHFQCALPYSLIYFTFIVCWCALFVHDGSYRVCLGWMLTVVFYTCTSAGTPTRN